MSPMPCDRGRRRFLRGSLALAGLGLCAGCGVLQPRVQQPAEVRRIGYLSIVAGSSHFEAFRQGLHDLGYVEGQNIAIEYRLAERPDQLPGLAAELVNLPVELIVGNGTPVAHAAKAATSTIPIVMGAFGDPVGSGLAASLARPGGNLTGLVVATAELHAKRLELLKEVIPGIGRVAVIWNAANPANVASFWPDTQRAGETLGLQLESVAVRGPDELDGAFAAVAGRHVDALMTLADGVLLQNRARIGGFALRGRLPSMFPEREFMEADGLMAYGAYIPDNFRRAATHVDRILRGTKPADLPIEQPTTFDFAINLKTARELGLTIPESVLQQATELIQ